MFGMGFHWFPKVSGYVSDDEVVVMEVLVVFVRPVDSGLLQIRANRWVRSTYSHTRCDFFPRLILYHSDEDPRLTTDVTF